MKLKNNLIYLIILWSLSWMSVAAAANSPNYQIQYSTQVNQLLNQINPQNMWDNLGKLTLIPDRSAQHRTGVDVQRTIVSQLNNLIQNSGRHDAMLYTVPTKGNDAWSGTAFNLPQSSIVLEIGSQPGDATVIGAHFDTITCLDEGCNTDPYGPLPGADDDGTGAVTLLETA